MKAPKKYKKGGKIKKYEDGGPVPLEFKGTPDDYISKPERKQKGTFGDYLSDYGRLMAKGTLGVVGADSLVKDKFKTQLGADANSIRNKYIEPIQQAVTSVALNTIAPGAGKIYNMGTGTIAGLTESASRKRMPEETDAAYSKRMADMGIDITDTPTGFEGLIKSGAEFGLAKALEQKMASGGEVGGGEKKKTETKNTETKATPAKYNYEEFYTKLNKYDKINPLDPKAAIEVKKEVGAIAPKLKEYNAMLRTSLEKKYNLKPGDPVNEEYLSLDEMKNILGSNFNDYIQSYDAYQAYRTKTAEIAPPRNTEGTEDTNKYVYGKRNASMFDPYKPTNSQIVSAKTSVNPAAIVNKSSVSDSTIINARKKYMADKAIQEQGVALDPSKITPEQLEEMRKNFGGVNLNLPQNKADGGEIKGKGTSKSDSIDAKVEPGSFVVPAENAHLAEQIREKYLSGKESKAKLNQGGGVPVKLSNGEHMFTPHEAEFLRKMGVDLEALAPNADDSNSYQDGGGVSEMKKAREARKKASQGAANKSKSDANSKAVNDIEVSLSNIDNDLRKIAEAYKKGATKFSGVDIDEAADKLEQMHNRQTAKYKQLTGSDYGKGKKVQDISSMEKTNETETSGSAQKGSTTSGKTSVGTKSSASGAVSTDNKKSKKESAASVLSELPSKNINQIKEERITSGNIEKKDAFGEKQNPATASFPKKENKKSGVTLEDVLAGGQILTGALALASDKRPIDTPNKDFEASLSRAKTDATYGFDPATRSTYEKDIEGARMDVINLASQLGGGNPQNVMAQARTATNQYAGNMLDFASADARFKLDKQRYSDSLIQDKVRQDRIRFQDKLNEFNQNQQAGAELISAGIENVLGSRRAERNKEMIDNISKNSQVTF